MRKIAIALLLLALAGCSKNTTLDTQIAQIQAATVSLCRFEPLAASVGEILSAGLSAPVSAIAKLICDQASKSQPQGLTGDAQQQSRQVCFEYQGKQYCVEGKDKPQ